MLRRVSLICDGMTMRGHHEALWRREGGLGAPFVTEDLFFECPFGESSCGELIFAGWAMCCSMCVVVLREELAAWLAL